MVIHALSDADSSKWTFTDENLALLVDRLDYWLSSEDVGGVTDPNDPGEKRRREERKRQGIKPPPVPIIPPVAKRPPEKARQAEELAAQLRDLYSHEDVRKPGESSLNALDRILG